MGPTHEQVQMAGNRCYGARFCCAGIMELGSIRSVVPTILYYNERSNFAAFQVVATAEP